METEAVKITQKGQVTIPKRIRDKLNATSVYFEVVNDEVVVRPVRDAAGSLSEYARKATPDLSIKQMKDRAWKEAVHEKAVSVHRAPHLLRYRALEVHQYVGVPEALQLRHPVNAYRSGGFFRAFQPREQVQKASKGSA